jgi:hypothetical protein
MKFIIKEDRLRDIIFKFLDSNVEIFDGDDGIYGDEGNVSYCLFYYEEYNTLYIYLGLIDKIINFFNISEYSDSKLLISMWFESKTGVIIRETIGKPETSLILKK